MMKKLLTIAATFLSAFSYAQVNFNLNQTINQAFNTDDNGYVITHQHTDKNGITHIYLKQSVNSKTIFNLDASLHLNKAGVVVYKTGSFADLTNVIKSENFKIGITDAIMNAASSKNLKASVASFKTIKEVNGRAEIESKETSSEKIFGKPGYILENNKLTAVWQIELYDDATNDWWCMHINAETGIKTSEHSYTNHCDINHIVSEKNHEYAFIFDDEPEAVILKKNGSNPTYRAWSMPLESPRKGPRQILSNLHNVDASPFGWHDTNGVVGADLLVTRGNNVYAKEDTLARNLVTGYSAPADTNFAFDFFYDENARPRQNLNAAITNLFVWNNYLHDIMYKYGFDESSGNFQYKNYTGQGADKDVVMAEAQDGSGTNNANFSTPVDGTSGRMQMYLWPVGTTSSNFLTITYPSAIAKEYLSPQTTQFGVRFSGTPITAKIVRYIDSDDSTRSLACVTPRNASAIAGNIAFIDRGTCNYTAKVLAAQQAGAIAVIVGNTQSGNPFAMTGTNTQINIPSVMISQTDANTLKSALAQDSVVARLVDPNANQKTYDSDFDNGVITHEYGHGISTRLTGGPANSSCLNNQEQAGEGWSDFYALVLTTRKWENKATARGIGNYLIDQDTLGLGIRPFRYSHNMSVNPATYNSIKTLSVPHGVGFVWASTLYDIMWDLIDLYGFDADIYNGKGGNNVILQLVTDGLKLQKCQPGFMDSRDAIIKADSILYGGKHAVLLWKAFARRGMGYSASQGLSTSRSDGTEAFDLPPGMTTTVADLNNALQMAAYPNPFNQSIHITMGNADVIKSVTIYTIDGKIINKHLFETNVQNVTIDTEYLQPGLYLFEASGNNQKHLIKAVKN